MFAVIVNTIAIILGTTMGLLLRRGIPKHISEAVMKALGFVLWLSAYRERWQRR